MGTMNISLPDPMKSWVEEQSKSGRYANSSDYVRDLIRRDRARTEAIAEIQDAVDTGLSRARQRRWIETGSRPGCAIDMPGSSRWAIRPAAQSDLSQIWHYGADTWGVEQAERYADGLFAVFDLLAEFPEMARERAEFVPPVRIHPSGAHLVIYRREGEGIEILRIMHARQNLTAYLLEG